MHGFIFMHHTVCVCVCVCVSYVQCLQELELLRLIMDQLNPLSFIDEVSF